MTSKISSKNKSSVLWLQILPRLPRLPALYIFFSLKSIDYHITSITRLLFPKKPWFCAPGLATTTRAPKIGTSSPIPDRKMIYDDLTILMYRNIIKNNSYPLPRKVWPEPPKLGRHLPYQIQWWYMITVTPCSFITVTNCSCTHLKLVKK